MEALHRSLCCFCQNSKTLARERLIFSFSVLKLGKEQTRSGGRCFGSLCLLFKEKKVFFCGERCPLGEVTPQRRPRLRGARSRHGGAEPGAAAAPGGGLGPQQSPSERFHSAFLQHPDLNCWYHVEYGVFIKAPSTIYLTKQSSIREEWGGAGTQAVDEGN